MEYVDAVNIDADFAYKVKGDCMTNARICDGDIVFVKQGKVQNGQIACINVDGDILVKRYYDLEDNIVLVPANSKYPPLVYDKKGDNKVSIIGRVIAVRGKIV